jgi:hypothetical protein
VIENKKLREMGQCRQAEKISSDYVIDNQASYPLLGAAA